MVEERKEVEGKTLSILLYIIFISTSLSNLKVSKQVK